MQFNDSTKETSKVLMIKLLHSRKKANVFQGPNTLSLHHLGKQICTNLLLRTVSGGQVKPVFVNAAKPWIVLKPVNQHNNQAATTTRLSAFQDWFTLSDKCRQHSILCVCLGEQHIDTLAVFPDPEMGTNR